MYISMKIFFQNVLSHYGIVSLQIVLILTPSINLKSSLKSIDLCLLCTDPYSFSVCVNMFMAIFVFVCLYVLMSFRKCSYSAWLSRSPMFLLCFYCLCSRMLNEYYIGGVPRLRSSSCWLFCCASRLLCTSPHAGTTALRFVLNSCQDTTAVELKGLLVLLTTSDDWTLPSPTMTRMYRADSQALHGDGRQPLIRAWSSSSEIWWIRLPGTWSRRLAYNGYGTRRSPARSTKSLTKK